MSKFVKFLLLGYDIMIGFEPEMEKSGGNRNDNVEELYSTIRWIEEVCNHHRLSYLPKQYSKKTGQVRVQVNDETGKGVPAQIKFFPLIYEKAENSYRREQKEINFIREITDQNGRLHKMLPVGIYEAEIARGSEYEITNVSFYVYSNKVSGLTIELIPMLNLKSEGWYCGDLHHHSIYSSPVYGGTDPVTETPQGVALSMEAMGASFGALSDHHNILNQQEWSATKSASFLPLPSKEISTSNGHIMSLGVEEDVIYQIPDQDNRSDTTLRREFIRVTEQIKELGGLPQINHPKDPSTSLSWNEDFNDILSCFETMELWNGSVPMMIGSSNYRTFLLWQKLLEKGCYIPATAGSDTHNILANDYHEIYNKLSRMAGLLSTERISLPKELHTQAVLLDKFFATSMPILKKWAECNLSSAGVRTYVHVEGELTQKKLLESLRRGHSFLTNGPILLPEIEGKHPGDVIKRKWEKVNINIRLIANLPLKKIMIYYNGNRSMEYHLEADDTQRKKYDYSRTLYDFDVRDVKWMFFAAEDDCTNMVITNPIFFENMK